MSTCYCRFTLYSVVLSFSSFLLPITPTNALATTAVTSLLEIRQRGVVLQQWDLSCGAAALATLMRYQHGLKTQEKEVAIELLGREEYLNDPNLVHVRQGFSLLDLKYYVERRGFQGSGFGGLDLDNLIDLAPAIVPVKLSGYNHFVVFRGIAGKRVLIADPAWGNRTLSITNFTKAWFSIGNLGRVGFVVRSKSNRHSSHRLQPLADDFVMFR